MTQKIDWEQAYCGKGALAARHVAVAVGRNDPNWAIEPVRVLVR